MMTTSPRSTGHQSEMTTNHITHTHTHPFNGPLSGTTQVSRYQKSKTNLDFTGARDSERQWYQLGHMQVCTLLQTDDHASTPPLSFLQAGRPSCRPSNSVKALKANHISKSKSSNHRNHRNWKSYQIDRSYHCNDNARSCDYAELQVTTTDCALACYTSTYNQKRPLCINHRM